jgi:hypothetical protein
MRSATQHHRPRATVTQTLVTVRGGCEGAPASGSTPTTYAATKSGSARHNGMGVRAREQCRLAFAGSRTRVHCLEGNYPNRWTTNAASVRRPPSPTAQPQRRRRRRVLRPPGRALPLCCHHVAPRRGKPHAYERFVLSTPFPFRPSPTWPQRPAVRRQRQRAPLAHPHLHCFLSPVSCLRFPVSCICEVPAYARPSRNSGAPSRAPQGGWK